MIYLRLFRHRFETRWLETSKAHCSGPLVSEVCLRVIANDFDAEKIRKATVYFMRVRRIPARCAGGIEEQKSVKGPRLQTICHAARNLAFLADSNLFEAAFTARITSQMSQRKDFTLHGVGVAGRRDLSLELRV